MAVRPVAAVSPFVRLKLRMLANGLRGRTWRVLLFIGGTLLGAYLGGMGFLLFAASAAGDAQVRLMVASFGGAALVLGSVLLPLVWFGVDDTLDPARFALLPLPRTRLVLGLLAAALVSVPAAALLLATAGLLVPAGVAGGPAAVVAQAVGLLAGLVLCVAAGRAVVSAFATMLRSRRVRDLAGILLAALAALLGPIQLGVVAAAQSADWDQLTRIARVVGWTPLAGAYTVGIEVAEGRPLAALAKLLVVAASVAGLLWWWSRTLESAQVGAASAGPARPSRPARAGAVAQLLPRLPGLPPTRTGALIARELRYWWRDAKRRANLTAVAVIAVMAPLLAGFGRLQVEPGSAGVSLGMSQLGRTSTLLVMAFVGAFASSMLANQFGFDGTAYAAHVTAAVPGRAELRARTAAHAVLTVPVIVAAGAVLALILDDPLSAVGGVGASFAGYGAGAAVSLFLSVLAPYPLPEGSNPFATASGTGIAKSLLALVAVVAALLICTPLLLLATALGEGWPWVAVPAGAGYGLAAVALATYLAGDLLDHRATEVLAGVTPRR